MRRLRRILTMALCPLLATTMLAGCGPTARATANMPEGPAITIGVAADMPGLSRFHDGSYSGFDINVATYVANQLVYAKKQIIFRSVTAANYQDKLSRRTVDFVAAPLPIGTGASSADATYAGPYLNAKQGLLIRTADTKRITSTASLADRNVCTVTGSGAAASIQRRQPAAHIQERDTYLQCVTALLVGEADAISGDDAALAGLAANEGSAYLHVVSDTFGSSLHAISVKTGERALAAKIDTILKQMVRSETWKSFAGQMSDQLRYTPSSKLNPPPIRSDNG